MRLIFITGSTDGLGRAAARTLMEEGHQVVLHARSRERAPAVTDLALRSAGVVIGDLSSAVETRKIAEQVNGIGRMDAVIHKAGTYLEPSRGATPAVWQAARSSGTPSFLFTASRSLVSRTLVRKPACRRCCTQPEQQPQFGSRWTVMTCSSEATTVPALPRQPRIAASASDRNRS
jgi:NAD(P)-dependent dehydrogenase (short-subunit alcohol dehydrogenase family)